MEWEREQDRNLPNIFSSPQPPVESTTPGPSNGQQQRPFGSGGIQRGSSFASNRKFLFGLFSSTQHTASWLHWQLFGLALLKSTETKGTATAPRTTTRNHNKNQRTPPNSFPFCHFLNTFYFAASCILLEGSFTSDVWGATTPKPFRQDSQLSAGAATTSRENSFTFGSGGGSFSRSHSPNNATPQGFANTGAATLHRDGSRTTSAAADTTEVMDVDGYPFTHNSAKTGGTEPFDMGSLRNGVVAEKGLAPRRGMPGKSRSSLSATMLGSRTSSMQYRGSGASQGTSKFWSDDDDSPNENMSWPGDDDQEEDTYGRREPGRDANRHKVFVVNFSMLVLRSIGFNFMSWI